MTNFRQILVALAAIQWTGEVTCAPLLQGFKISRDINIEFKPFQFRPISYIMEKWGPFGAFGKKYAIAKRDVDAVLITPSPLQPSSGVSSVGPAFASPAPAPVVEVTPDNPPPPVNISPMPITSGIPPTAISNDIFQEVGPVIPVAPANRLIGSDFNSNRLTGLNTDISRMQPLPQIINPTPVYDNTPLRVNLLPPVSQPDVPAAAEQPPPEIPSRGGVIARMFGEFILQLFSRLINSARSSFGQLSSRVQ